MRDNTSRDYASRWFELAESVGEYAHFFLGTQGADALTWRAVRHAEHDGIGGLLAQLRAAGITNVAVPSRNERRPSWLRRTRAIWRMLRKPQSTRAARFAAFDTSFRLTQALTAPSVRAAHFFTREETTALIARAKTAQATVNSLLLLALDRAVHPDYQQDETSQWIVPVNMRGAVPLASDVCNGAASLTIAVSPNDTAGSINAQVHQLLAEHAHWAAWWLLSASAWLSPNAMKRVAKKAPPFTGAFSNLGVWTVPELQEQLVFVPHTFLSYPLAAGAITVNGRLALGLQVHPALHADPNEWLRRWRASLAST